MGGNLTIRTSNSTNHFIDTNVILHHANNDSGQYAPDIATILEEAVGTSPKRKLWVSNILFGELRPSYFEVGKFKNYDEFVRYIRSIATVVSPDPNVMLGTARVRDISWKRSNPMPDEKEKRLTLGDALHLMTALWVKEAVNVPDLEFLTLDNKSGTSIETDIGTKSLPLLDLENYTSGIGSNPDVIDLINLPRTRPILRQATIDFPS